MLQWLSADPSSACCLPGPLQQGAPQAHRFALCSLVTLSQVQHFDLRLFMQFLQPPVPAVSEDDSPLWNACLALQLRAFSKLPKASFLFCLNFQLLTSFRSHIFPNTLVSPQRLCLLCSPVQKFSLTVDCLDRARHPGCLGRLLEWPVTDAALYWV